MWKYDCMFHVVVRPLIVGTTNTVWMIELVLLMRIECQMLIQNRRIATDPSKNKLWANLAASGCSRLQLSLIIWDCELSSICRWLDHLMKCNDNPLNQVVIEWWCIVDVDEWLITNWVVAKWCFQLDDFSFAWFFNWIILFLCCGEPGTRYWAWFNNWWCCYRWLLMSIDIWLCSRLQVWCQERSDQTYF